MGDTRAIAIRQTPVAATSAQRLSRRSVVTADGPASSACPPIRRSGTGLCVTGRDGPSRSSSTRAVSKDAGIARLILVNGPPASGKSTLARRYVDDHDGAALVEVDTLQMTLPNWEKDEATRLAAAELAGAAIVEHLGAGRDVVMAQYFGRLGYIVLLEDVAREQGATFV